MFNFDILSFRTSGRLTEVSRHQKLHGAVVQKDVRNDEVLDASVDAVCGEFAALVAEHEAEASWTGASS